MPIHESGENYLEKILMLSETNEKIRAVDLSAALGFSRPTVSIMLRELRANGFVDTAPNGGLVLTPAGEAVARPLYEQFVARMAELTGKQIATGEFGADMQVGLINDGPVTIWIDSKNR